MNRLSLVVTCLVGLSGCLDQQAVDTTTTDQDLTGVSVLSTVYPTHFDPKIHNSLDDFWDLGAPVATGAAVVYPNYSHHMVVVRTNGEPAIPCVNFASGCFGGQPATRMAWLISNSRVFKVYEIDVGSDLNVFNNSLSTLYKNFEFTKSGVSGGVGDSIVGSDFGPVTGGGIHIGPPRGFPLALVSDMKDYALQVRTLAAGAPDVGGSLAPPTVTAAP